MNDLQAFRELGVSESILDALRAKGFEAPSPIQELAIPKLLDGSLDIIGQAQTGTGKTAAFGIPIIELCEPRSRKPEALVLAPTRELSIQIAEEMNSLKGKSALSIAPFYGGQAIEVQFARLRDGVDVVIGTPGRVLDLIHRGKLDFSELKFAVLDEADEMLDMGFAEELEAILAETNPDKRMLMFSATMPDAILSIAEKYMREYEVIRTESTQLSTELTEQIWFEVRREEKFEALSRIIDMEKNFYALVFCRTRNDVDELVEKLKLRGHRVEALHGDIAQVQRTKVISQFKAKKFRILIATDVAARGIDVNDLTHVINYSMPQGTETYVHRIGRTGRAGKTGVAITFVTPAEYRRLSLIQREAGTKIEKKELPQGRDIVELKKQRFTEELAEVIEGGQQKDYIGFAEEMLSTFDSPADLVAAFLQLRFQGELLPGNYTELGAAKKQRDRRSWETGVDDRGQARLYIGIGKRDGYGAVRVLDLLWEKARIKKYLVGKIDCFDNFSFVNVDFENAEKVIAAFRKGGPKVQMAAEREPGEEPMTAERPPRPAPASAPREPREVREPAKKEGPKMPKTPPAEKRRKLQNWVEKLSADVELKEKRKKKK